MGRGAVALVSAIFTLMFLVTIGDQKERHLSQSLSKSTQARQHDISIFPDDRYRRLIHFVQVTDLHVNMYKHPERKDDFARFINETLLDVIKPPVVIMSGDIVDALGSSFMSSHQNLPEWEDYARIIRDTNVTKHLEWLDVRGNHDNLNLPSTSDEKNYFKKYSVRGPKHNHSYKFVYEHGDEKIAFVGIDTCMDPGSRRPFNFFGRLTEERFDEVFRLKDEVRNSNYTVYFGHHPSSVIFGGGRQGQSFRDIFANSGPYLCGHYHTAGDIVNKMYYKHNHNALELELGDFKVTRRFRVLSIDNGLLNFVDVETNKYPIILVTNPKEALFHMPEYEPIERIAYSTHIRILVFSDAGVAEVKLKIDDGEEQFLTQVDKTSLFILPWDASKYSKGLHWIKVFAEDDAGRSRSISFQFSLDGSSPEFDFIAKIVLNLSKNEFLAILIVQIACIVVPLVLLRLRYGYRMGRSPTKKSTLACRFIFQMTLLSSIDRIFYPLVIFPIYVCLGPWFIGHMLDGELSLCFMWGAFFHSSFVPGGIIIFYAVLLLAVYYVPFVILLSYKVHATFATHFNSSFTEYRVLSVMRNLCLVTTIAIQVFWASLFWFAFGWLAVIFGFLPTGSLIFTAVLWRMAAVLPRNLFVFSRDSDYRPNVLSAAITGDDRRLDEDEQTTEKVKP